MSNINMGIAEFRSQLSAEDRARIDERKRDLMHAASMFREIRKEFGLTQVQAADRLGTRQANVSKMEKRATVDLDQISKMAGDDFEVVLVVKSKTGKHRREIAIA